MRLIQVKYMVSRRAEALIFVREKECMDVVDELCHGAEADFCTVVVEDVERQRRDNGVPHGGLLFKKVIRRKEIGVVLVPAAPFVDAELCLVFQTIGQCGRPVAVNQILHGPGSGDERPPVVVCEVHGAAGGAAVIMEGQTIHPHLFFRQLFKHAAGPRKIRGVGAAADQLQPLGGIGHELCIAAVFTGIAGRRHIAAAAPVFVADPPELYLIGRRVTVCRTGFCQRR